MDRLSIGMHVDIQRSDGRVHGALITNLRHDTKVVSVEWFEKGETKGKEIDLMALMRNNQTLFQQAAPPVNAAPPVEKLIPPTTRSRASVLNQNQTQAIPAPVSQTSKLNDTISEFSNKSEPRRTTMGTKTENNNNTDAARKIVATSRIPPVRSRPNNITSNIPSTMEVPKPMETEVLPPLQEETTVIPAPKSQVVSKIEELEKNREQRRVQQNEAKKHKELQKAIDPGNPNWQFLSMIRDYQSQVDYRPLRIIDEVGENRICVCIRKRPINKKEIGKKEIEVITIPNKDHVIVHQPQVKVDLTKYLDNQVFRFDYTFDENTTNEMVYKFTAQPLVRTVFQRGFATCFAYGQTGSGKTHTMGGIFDGKTQDCSNGVYALTAMDVFKQLNSPEYRGQGLSASCSFFEIYGAKVFDLLGKKAKLRVLEDGKRLVQVVGLKEFKVHSPDDVLRLIKQGSDQRTAGQTSANSNSSRSHAVFQIILRKKSEIYL
ncbi:kinesin motor domain-containing protein [Ditylenchus destructor]|nr:kinesin motor domain-containing protein [Ditylenchus destructor]